VTLEAFFSAIATWSVLLLVVASMLATGLSLNMAQILQPLKGEAVHLSRKQLTKKEYHNENH
jgi:hypothetical protein